MGKEISLNLSAGDLTPTGSRIRLRRRVVGIGLSQLARDIGYDRGYLSSVENNRPKVSASEELLDKIAKKLDTTTKALTKGPLVQLTNGLPPEQFATKASFREEPKYLSRPRPLLNRIGRILVMGHL